LPKKATLLVSVLRYRSRYLAWKEFIARRFLSERSGAAADAS
jgi:hypothetical protein